MARNITETLKKLFFVARPVSWPNTAYPFAAGWLVAGGAVNPVLVIATLFFLAPYNLLMYGVNDVFDYESDIRNPRKGGIEGMREQRAFHPTILRASIIASVPFVLYLLIASTFASGLVLIGLLFFVVAYSLKGLRFKEIPVLDSITSSIHFVGPLVYALSFFAFPAGAWSYVAAFFLWGAASHMFGAVQDIVPDRAGGLSSIATFLGARRTVRLATILYLGAAIIVIAQGGLSVLVGVTGLAYVVNIVRYLNVGDKDSGRTNRAWRRFIWLNLFAGFVVTLVLIIGALM